MALQNSGAISLSQIQTEFGGSNPISLNEYYGAGTLPTSGAISFFNFYGQSAVETYTFAAGTHTDVDLGDLSLSRAGDVLIIIPSNAILVGSGGSSYLYNGNYINRSDAGDGLRTGASGIWGGSLTILNNGVIKGGGGEGGLGSYGNSQYREGYAGGVGVQANSAVFIDNNGTIIGGGGGGGGGGGYYSSSRWGSTSQPGGGGGGGAPNGQGGRVANGSSTGFPGNNATYSTYGAGGIGSTSDMGDGGNGGNAGQSGIGGGTTSWGEAGWPAGAAGATYGGASFITFI